MFPSHDQFILGKGHMKFFYNKIGWLLNRYNKLRYELLERGYQLDNKLYHSVVKSVYRIATMWYSDYQPKPEDIYLNMVRLCKRSKIPPVMREFYP